MTMLDSVWSAMAEGYRPRPRRRGVSDLQHERPPRSVEVADVDALGPADATAADQWLVDVPEQVVAGLHLAVIRQQGGAADLEPPGRGVVGEFGDGRWDVAEEDVDRPQRGHGGGELRLRQLVRGAHRADQPAADESPPLACHLDHPTVDDAVPVAQEFRPEGGHVDVSVGQEGRSRHGREEVGVLLLHHRPQDRPPVLGVGDAQPSPGRRAALGPPRTCSPCAPRYRRGRGLPRTGRRRCLALVRRSRGRGSGPRGRRTRRHRRPRRRALRADPCTSLTTWSRTPVRMSCMRSH